MKLSDTALADLCARSLWAAEQGYEIALASLYLSLLIEEVGSEAPPVGVAVGSTAHLAVLAADAYAIRLGKMEKKASKPVKEAAPPVAPPADEAPPAEKAEEASEKAEEPAAAEEAPAAEATEPAAEETPAAAKKSAKAKK